MIVLGTKARFRVDALTFVADNRLVGLTHDHRLGIWAIDNSQTAFVDPPRSLESVWATPQRLVATPTGTTVYLSSTWYGALSFDLKTLQFDFPGGRPFRAATVALSRDGQTLVTPLPGRDFAITAWDLRHHLPRRLWHVEVPEHYMVDCVVDPTQDYLWVVQQTGDVYPGTNVLVCRSLRNGRLLKDWPGINPEGFVIPYQSVEQLAVSPSGDTIVVRTGMTLIIVPIIDDERQVRFIQNDNRKHFTRIEFHPNGRTLAAASNDKTIKLYDTADWKLRGTFTWNAGKMRSFACSPDGTLAAAGTDTGQIVVWDVDA